MSDEVLGGRARSFGGRKAEVCGTHETTNLILLFRKNRGVTEVLLRKCPMVCPLGRVIQRRRRRRSASPAEAGEAKDYGLCLFHFRGAHRDGKIRSVNAPRGIKRSDRKSASTKQHSSCAPGHLSWGPGLSSFPPPPPLLPLLLPPPPSS